MPPKQNIIGNRYGRLTVVSESGYLYGKHLAYLCRCDCGDEKVIVGMNLRDGKSLSCGCLRQDVSRTIRRTHGLSRTKVHQAWKGLKARCLNPSSKSFARYGGAGITVCNEWRDSFESFYRDVGEPTSPRHSIDRIDNARGYEPGNCRWATYRQQNQNRSCARSLTAFGETKNIGEWSRDPRCRTSRGNIRGRIALGWSAEESLATPTRGKH